MRAGQELGIAGLASEAEKQLDKLWKKTPASLTDAYLAVAKAQGISPQNFAKRLLASIRQLEKFNKVPTEAEALAQNMVAHSLDPKTGQGRYEVVQHHLRGFSSALYGLSSAFPGLIPQEALEDVGQELNANRRVGAYYRHWQTYVLNKDERESSLQKTLNQNRLFRAIAKAGVFGLTVDDADPDFIPESETNELITKWGESALSARRRARLIASGNLDKAHRSAEFKALGDDVRNLTKIGKKLGGQVEFASKQIKYQTDVLRGGNGVGGLTSLVGGALLGKAIKDLFHSAGDMLESYWGESVTRNVYASRKALLGRETKGLSIAGGLIGGLLGAVMGGAFGAQLGYAAGSEVMSWGGKYREIKFQSDMKSSDQMMNRVRNKSLYGGGYNSYFAQAISDMGIANGEAAMGGLADKAMSLRGRMMLGQVGEQEMLYYTMMPNFFSALMEGKTGPELMRIYQQDLAGIADPSLRYLVGQAIGNTEAFAMANSPHFGSFYGKAASVAGYYEGSVGRFENGYVGPRVDVAAGNITKGYEEIAASARRGDSLIYKGGYATPVYQAALDQAERLNIGKNPLTVIVNVDGVEAGRDEKSADEIYQQSLSSFYVGG